MTTTENLPITELLSKTIDAARDHVAQFTVGLNRVFSQNSKLDSNLIGAGTLVQVAGLDCIITAEHVLAALGKSDRLSVASSFEGKPRGHEFDLNHLVIHRIARGQRDEEGPDIGLIVLPQQNIGTLRSEKIFYNIDKRIQRFASGYVPRDRGFWVNCGLVGETKVNLAPPPGFSSLKRYEGLCGVSANPTETDDGVFDYLDVRIDYGPQSDLPSSFGGMSGGGLWQVPLRKTTAGEIEPEEYILSGVTFYETAFENGMRKLRCHGRRTVYEFVPNYVCSQKAGVRQMASP